MKQDDTLQKALSDLAQIRQAIERSRGKGQGALLSSVPVDFHLFLQGGALFSALLLLGIEFATKGLQTQTLLLSKYYPEIQVGGMSSIAVFLILVVTLSYVSVRAGARKAEEDTDGFIARNFFYLKNLSLVSDLFVKFCIFTMFVVAGKPEWIAILLILFTGDYALQGRLFTLPPVLSVICGQGAFVAAAACYFYGVTSLIAPLLVFSSVSALSVIRLLAIRRKLSQGEA